MRSRDAAIAGGWSRAVVPTLAAAGLGTAVLAVYGGSGGPATWEVEATRSLQAWDPPPMRAVAEFMTAAGHSPLYPLTALCAGIALLWARRPSLAVLLLTAVLFRGLSPVFKAIVERPRPSPALIDVTHRLQDPSFPSGHVLGATLLYGFLVYAVEVTVPHIRLRRSIQAVLVGLIGLMGYARVEMGEHWPTDVLGGWLIGLLLLSAIIFVHRRVARSA